jgi:hypothetical protein
MHHGLDTVTDEDRVDAESRLSLMTVTQDLRVPCRCEPNPEPGSSEWSWSETRPKGTHSLIAAASSIRIGEANVTSATDREDVTRRTWPGPSENAVSDRCPPIVPARPNPNPPAAGMLQPDRERYDPSSFHSSSPH